MLTHRLDHTASQYAHDCAIRVETSTIVFTRECLAPPRGGFRDPAHARGYHLSLTCIERAERDLWVRAFFGPDLPNVWAHWSVPRVARAFHVSHWRLFCDEHWSPIVVRNTADVMRAGWRSVIELEIAAQPS